MKLTMVYRMKKANKRGGQPKWVQTEAKYWMALSVADVDALAEHYGKRYGDGPRAHPLFSPEILRNYQHLTKQDK